MDNRLSNADEYYEPIFEDDESMTPPPAYKNPFTQINNVYTTQHFDDTSTYMTKLNYDENVVSQLATLGFGTREHIIEASKKCLDCKDINSVIDKLVTNDDLQFNNQQKCIHSQNTETCDTNETQENEPKNLDPWECDLCQYTNIGTDEFCIMCSNKKPKHKAIPKPEPVETKAPPILITKEQKNNHEKQQIVAEYANNNGYNQFVNTVPNQNQNQNPNNQYNQNQNNNPYNNNQYQKNNKPYNNQNNEYQNNNQHSNHKQHQLEFEMEGTLLLMGFQKKYITRAFTVHKNNYGNEYDMEIIIEIIAQLEHEHTIQNQNNTIVNNKTSLFYNTSNKPMNEWTRHQLKDWIHSLDMIATTIRNKIINGIEQFQIEGNDFYECQNGHDISDTFDVPITIGTLVYTQMIKASKRYKQTIAAYTQNNKTEMKIQKRRRKAGTSWKRKPVREWNCDEIQDWIYGLNVISEEDKNKLMFTIEGIGLTGDDFVSCQNAEDIVDSFDGVSMRVANIILEQLQKLASNVCDDVGSLFYAYLSAETYKIVEIRKISTRQNSIYEQILQEKCDKSGKTRCSVEKLLWHGSKKIDNINLICKNGFDRSYNTTSMYGAGTYFAAHAHYSVTRGYCGKDKYGISYVLLCKVIVGDYIKGNKEMKKIPRKANGEEYDSLVDNTLNPAIFVIWRDYHAIPHYLIKYKAL